MQLTRLGSRWLVASEITLLALLASHCGNVATPCAFGPGQCEDGGSAGDGGGSTSPVCEEPEPGSCPDPLLAYDPEVKEIGALYPDLGQVNDVIAGRMEPFAVPTTCKSVVVALQTSGACNKVGDLLDIAVFDSEEDVPEGAHPSTNVPLDPETAVQLSPTGVAQFTFPLVSHHDCGLYPFVAVRLRNINTCIAAATATCDATNSFRQRANSTSWEDATTEPVQVYLGLADCSPD